MEKQLIIKIKMPPGGSDVRFQCPTCKKSFSSGKGLGGHKRVHLQTTAAMNQSNERNPELRMIIHPGINAENTHPCPVCQQQWPSIKSLHGHMRKHRDRNWRGMIPPTPTPQLLAIGNGDQCVNAALQEGSSSADRDYLALVVASDVRPSGGAERRRRHGRAPMGMIPEAEKDSVSVANNLMALSTGEPSQKEGFKRKKRKLELGSSSTAVPAGGGHGRLPGQEAAANSLLVQKMLIRSSGLKKFVCKICNKTYKTYQALGGHKSHHIPDVGEGNVGVDKSAAADGFQPCPGGDKENSNQAKIFSFDLNELPPPE